MSLTSFLSTKRSSFESCFTRSKMASRVNNGLLRSVLLNLPGQELAETLTPDEAFHIAMIAHKNNKYLYGLLWMQEALKQLVEGRKATVTRKEVLAYLAPFVFQMGDLPRAINLTEQLLELGERFPRRIPRFFRCFGIKTPGSKLENGHFNDGFCCPCRFVNPRLPWINHLKMRSVRFHIGTFSCHLCFSNKCC